MNQPDFSFYTTSSDKKLCFVSTLTNNAQENNEFEIHTHYDEFEIYHFVKGSLFFAFEGKRFEIKDGTMIIISKGTLHRPIIKQPCVYYRKRLLFSKDLFAGFDLSQFDFYNVLSASKIMVFDAEAVSNLQLDEMFEEIEEGLSQNTEYGDFCATVSLFSFLIKAVKSENTINPDSFELHNDKILEIIRYINDNLTNDLNYKEIANRFFFSEKSLYKFFKKNTGFSLGSYIKERRIIKSQELLIAGKSANDAAAGAGFKDYTTFYRSFLKKTGIAPMEYIKSRKK